MLKALDSVLDDGRGRGTREANTAVVPQGTSRHHSQTHLVNLAVVEGHRIGPERWLSPGRKAFSSKKIGLR